LRPYVYAVRQRSQAISWGIHKVRPQIAPGPFALARYIRCAKECQLLAAAFRSSQVIGAGTHVVLTRGCHHAAFGSATRAAIDRLGGDPEAFVRSHVRRLEALRRAGHAERMDADHWRVPADLPERGQAYDLARDRANIRVGVLSPTGLDQQVGHDGATWLDRELVSRQRIPLAGEGFGREVRAAIERRKQALVNMGHVTDVGAGNIRAPKDLIQRLEAVDLERAGKALAAERGLQWRPAVPGNTISGQLVGSAQLSSGRFAMIESFGGDGGLGFSLVPWQPVLDKRIGRHISGVAMPGGGVDWSFARSRGLGLCAEEQPFIA
jgi:hypothetical protein